MKKPKKSYRAKLRSFKAKHANLTERALNKQKQELLNNHIADIEKKEAQIGRLNDTTVNSLDNINRNTEIFFKDVQGKLLKNNSTITENFQSTINEIQSIWTEKEKLLLKTFEKERMDIQSVREFYYSRSEALIHTLTKFKITMEAEQNDLLKAIGTISKLTGYYSELTNQIDSFIAGEKKTINRDKLLTDSDRAKYIEANEKKQIQE